MLLLRHENALTQLKIGLTQAKIDITSSENFLFALAEKVLKKPCTNVQTIASLTTSQKLEMPKKYSTYVKLTGTGTKSFFSGNWMTPSARPKSKQLVNTVIVRR